MYCYSCEDYIGPTAVHYIDRWGRSVCMECIYNAADASEHGLEDFVKHTEEE